jgi:nucleotide-binding universal stress UspA family protein
MLPVNPDACIKIMIFIISDFDTCQHPTLPEAISLYMDEKAMKRILVPCDFSLKAGKAFSSAMAIAEKNGAEIHLLHVIEIPVLHDAVLMPVLSFEEALFKELEDKANVQFQKMIGENQQDISITTKVVFGVTSRLILDYISDKHIDLVVMGTRGATGLREMLIGSNTEKIVRNSKAPVLAVRNALKVDDVRDIVFPNTLETANQEALVLKVKALQNFFHAQLHIVWINTPTNFTADATTKKRLFEFAQRFMLKDFTINIYNDVYEESGIINFSHEINASMLAMGTHGRKGLAHLFSGSLTEDVVNHIDLPIWTSSIQND